MLRSRRWGNQGAESPEFPVGTTAEPIVEACTTSDYGSPKCIAVSPTDPVYVSVQVPVSGMSPGAWSRQLDSVSSGYFEFPRASSHRFEHLSTSGWPLTVPMMVGVQTTMMTTVMMHLWGVAVVATSALPGAGEPWSMVPVPTAFAELAYPPYASWLLPILQ